MTLLSLSPTNLAVGGGSPTDISAAAFTSIGANTGVLFQNTGREILLVQTGSGGSTTVTSDIGVTVQGQTVPGVAPGSAQPASKTYVYGPYPAQYDEQNGTQDIEVDFGTQANVSGVLLLHIPGVI